MIETGPATLTDERIVFGDELLPGWSIARLSKPVGSVALDEIKPAYTSPCKVIYDPTKVALSRQELI